MSSIYRGCRFWKQTRTRVRMLMLFPHVFWMWYIQMSADRWSNHQFTTSAWSSDVSVCFKLRSLVSRRLESSQATLLNADCSIYSRSFLLSPRKARDSLPTFRQFFSSAFSLTHVSLASMKVPPDWLRWVADEDESADALSFFSKDSFVWSNYWFLSSKCLDWLTFLEFCPIFITL